MSEAKGYPNELGSQIGGMVRRKDGQRGFGLMNRMVLHTYEKKGLYK